MDELSRQFYALLWRGGTYAYWWASGRKHTTWFELAQPLEHTPQVKDIYHSVYPLRIATPGKDGKLEHGRGKLDNVAALTCLFAEFDAKEQPEAGEWYNVETKKFLRNPTQAEMDTVKAIVLEKIRKLPVPPTAIIDSGGGYHCYWFFTRPLAVFDTNLEQARQLQAAWVEALMPYGADDGAKDLSRVLRVPGSINGKAEYSDISPTGLPVRFLEFDENKLYEPQALAQAVHFRPTAGANGNGHHPEPEAPKTISEDEEPEVPAAQAHESGGGGGRGRPGALPPIDDVKRWVASLNPKRAEEYATWVEIGMTLRGFGDVGRELFHDFSKKSSKYDAGETEKKWQDIQDTGTRQAVVTWKTLRENAKVDEINRQVGTVNVPMCPDNPKPWDYRIALEAMGYNFRYNVVANRIEFCKGTQSDWRPLDDNTEPNLHNDLRAFEYKRIYEAEDVWRAWAVKDQYHPIRVIMNKMAEEWDGKPHVAKLATYFVDKDEVFPRWLERWLVATVARVYEGKHHAVLVMAGAQGIGKSYFARWLCGPFGKDYFDDKPLDPDSKDHRINLARRLIWEIKELGAITRRKDMESLKAILSQEVVQDRPPYGKTEIQFDAMVSFIGTVNPSGVGFLNDPTGSRRFLVSHLYTIDHSYTDEVDVYQVWCEACYKYLKLHDVGELEEAEKLKAAEIASNYEASDPVADVLDTLYEITGEGEDKEWTKTILDNYLKMSNTRLNEGAIYRAISEWATKRNLGVPVPIRKGTTLLRGYRGLRLRPGALDSTIAGGINSAAGEY